MRKGVGLLVLLCVAGLVVAQDKEKAKDKEKKDDKVKMIVVKVDAKAMTLTLKPSARGKETEYTSTKTTKFIGPRGGKRDINDDVLKPGVTIQIVADGTTLKEVHLPTRESKDKDKKEKDKKEK